MKPTTFEREIEKIVKYTIERSKVDYDLTALSSVTTNTLLSLIQTTIRESLPEKVNSTYYEKDVYGKKHRMSNPTYDGFNQCVDYTIARLKEKGIL